MFKISARFEWEQILLKIVSSFSHIVISSLPSMFLHGKFYSDLGVWVFVVSCRAHETSVRHTHCQVREAFILHCSTADYRIFSFLLMTARHKRAPDKSYCLLAVTEVKLHHICGLFYTSWVHKQIFYLLNIKKESLKKGVGIKHKITNTQKL